MSSVVSVKENKVNENKELQAGTYSILLKIGNFLYIQGGTSTRARYMLNSNMSLLHELSSETSPPQPKLNGVFLYRICILCKSCVAMTEAYDICFANIRQIIF